MDVEDARLIRARCGRIAGIGSITVLIVYLLGTDAGYVTGAVIPIDGGSAAVRGKLIHIILKVLYSIRGVDLLVEGSLRY